MKHSSHGICQFKKVKPPLTVGDVFEMHCQWSKSISVVPPIRWELVSKKQSPYSLVVLKTLSLKEGGGVFQVTSYVPGNYQLGIRMLAEKNSVHFSPLSWNVQSVIPKEKQNTIQAYPPYGPWVQSLPMWYSLSLVFLTTGLISLIIYRLWVFLKRKKWLKIVQHRRNMHDPFQHFISELMKIERNLKNLSDNFIQKLKTVFCSFLEEEFFIPFKDYSFSEAIKKIQAEHPMFFKKHQKKIVSFFKEIFIEWTEKENSHNINRHTIDDHIQLLDMGKQLGIQFFLYKQTLSKQILHKQKRKM